MLRSKASSGAKGEQCGCKLAVCCSTSSASSAVILAIVASVAAKFGSCFGLRGGGPGVLLLLDAVMHAAGEVSVARSFGFGLVNLFDFTCWRFHSWCWRFHSWTYCFHCGRGAQSPSYCFQAASSPGRTTFTGIPVAVLYSWTSSGIEDNISFLDLFRSRSFIISKQGCNSPEPDIHMRQ